MAAKRVRSSGKTYGGIWFSPPRSVKFFPEDDHSGTRGDEDDKKKKDNKQDDDDDDKGEDPKGKKFSQEQVDRILAKERREANTKHLSDTEKLLASKDLSEKERQKLEQRKTELEDALMTEKQQAEEKVRKLDKDWKTKYDEKENAEKLWKQRFGKSLIRRTIMDAAKAAGAHDETQILDMFENKATTRELLGDDSKPTGEFEVVIEITEKSEDGKQTKKVLPIDKYIMEVHAAHEKSKNLYDSNRKGGTGSRPGSSGGKAGGPKLTARERIARGLAAGQE